MHTIRISGIDRSISRICLGCGPIGSAIPRDDAFRMLDAFAAAGGTFLDTAHIYAAWLPGGEGASESTIGSWIASRGAERTMVVATKGGHPPLGSPIAARLRPEHIAQDLGESLARLSLPAVDLYWLHRDDPEIPVTEIIGVLEEHRRAGRIRSYGASNWSTARLSAAQATAHRQGSPGFIASQIGWSLAQARPEHIPPVGMLFKDGATLAWHGASRMRVIPYSSQASGFFAKDTPMPLYDTVENQRRRERVRALALQRGASANAIALAWLLAHPAAGCAIIGSRTLEQLEDSLGADAISLDTATCARLDLGR